MLHDNGEVGVVHGGARDHGGYNTVILQEMSAGVKIKPADIPPKQQKQAAPCQTIRPGEALGFL